MNTAEEMALIALVQATTHEARRRALQAFRARGVRLSETAAAAIQTATVSTTSASAVVLAPHPADNVAKRLEPGPKPFLRHESERDLAEWLLFWVEHERLTTHGASTPGALLLHGPPGTGKTTAASWIAGELGAQMPAFVLDAHDWISSHLGESGSKLSRVFDSLRVTRGLLVLEELDAVGSRRGGTDMAGREENRITVALMRLIESAEHPVVATTNRLDALDPALVRRFDYVVEVAEPSQEQKAAIAARILGRAPTNVDLGMPVVDLVRVAKRERRLAALDVAAERRV